MKTAYIFRGSPASGKGTITSMFVKSLKGKVALLELDTFRWAFHLHTREVKDVTDEEHRFAYENFLLLLKRYCQNGTYTIVIEGLFSWDTPSPHGTMTDIIDILKKHGFPYYPIVLTGDKETLWKRNAERDYIVPRHEFDELYQNVMQKIGPEEIQIDVSDKTAQKTLEEITLKINASSR
jgi:hypothetical protein